MSKPRNQSPAPEIQPDPAANAIEIPGILAEANQPETSSPLPEIPLYPAGATEIPVAPAEASQPGLSAPAPAIRTVPVKAKSRIEYDGKTHPPGTEFAMEPEVAELAAQHGAIEFINTSKAHP